MALDDFKKKAESMGVLNKSIDSLAAEIKKLEDEIIECSTNNRKEVFKLVTDNFSKFLKENGFSVVHQENNLIATYEEEKLTLIFPPVTENSSVCIANLRFINSMRPKDEWHFELLEKGMTHVNSLIGSFGVSNILAPSSTVTKEEIAANNQKKLFEQLKELNDKKDKLSLIRPEYCVAYYKFNETTNSKHFERDNALIASSISEVLEKII